MDKFLVVIVFVVYCVWALFFGTLGIIASQENNKERLPLTGLIGSLVTTVVLVVLFGWAADPIIVLGMIVATVILIIFAKMEVQRLLLNFPKEKKKKTPHPRKGEAVGFNRYPKPCPAPTITGTHFDDDVPEPQEANSVPDFLRDYVKKSV